MKRATTSEKNVGENDNSDDDEDDDIQFFMNLLHGFFNIESMSHHVLCMFCGFAATIKDGMFDSPGKATSVSLSSFLPMVALSFLVSLVASFDPLHVDRINPLKHDQNYSGGLPIALADQSQVWAPTNLLEMYKLQLNPEPSLGGSMKTWKVKNNDDRPTLMGEISEEQNNR